jgi:ECF transporter S component (folate family)
MHTRTKRAMTTKTMAYCALLASLSVVLARLVIPMPAADTRFSIEAVPVFLAGMLFGPIPGALVGFAADFVGCLFSPFGYNPIFSVPPILYGLFGGVFRFFLCNKVTLPKLTLSLLAPVVLGSILYQSATLAFIYYDGVFFKGFLFYLTTRSIQFGITLVLDVLVIYLLCKANIFQRIGIWPSRRK